VSQDGDAIARSLVSPEAFTQVFDQHYASIHRFIARRAGRETADDLAAQTFTLAFAHRGRYRDDLGTARPWLLGIATNLLRAEHRTEERQLQVVERLGHEAMSSSGMMAGFASSASEDDERLDTALAGLHPDQRDALLLHALGDLSYAEIAGVLEIPVGTVRSRISRACATLRLELDPAAPALAGDGEKTDFRRNHG
jgi:RNA polymerase sigma-70 factor (ECF subfamily)